VRTKALVARTAVLVMLSPAVSAGGVLWNDVCPGSSGRVVDHLTEAPIAGARVYAGHNPVVLAVGDGCFLSGSVFTEQCRPDILDCAFSFGVDADDYVGWGESGWTSSIYTYVPGEVRLTTLASAVCRGDCDDDGGVAVDEVGCTIAAALAAVAIECTCVNARAGEVADVADAVAAARNVVYGCVDCGPGEAPF
jgi:hypothetical protein